MSLSRRKIPVGETESVVSWLSASNQVDNTVGQALHSRPPPVAIIPIRTERNSLAVICDARVATSARYDADDRCDLEPKS